MDDNYSELRNGNDLLNAELAGKQFIERGNSFAGIESFMTFVRLGRTPPIEVLEWVATCFSSYLQGNIKLDEAFNVSQSKKRAYQTFEKYTGYRVSVVRLVPCIAL